MLVSESAVATATRHERNMEALARVPLFSVLTDDERRALAARATVRALGRDESLWHEGGDATAFSFVLRGRMKLVKRSSAGAETILDTLGNGELLCVNPVYAAAGYCCTGNCMEPGTEVVSIPREDVLAMTERNPKLARALLEAVSERGRGMCTRVAEMGAGKAEQRIAALLVRLAERVGVRSERGVRIPIPFTRQDVAALCGTAHETTIRVISAWRKKGWVEDGARGLVVVELDILTSLAAGEPAPAAT